MLRGSGSVVGGLATGTGVVGITAGGAAMRGTKKWALTWKPVMYSSERTVRKLLLRASIAYGMRKAASSLVVKLGISPNSRILASTRIAWLCGCGPLATGAIASRLSENACDTASACGVPALAP